MANTEKVNALSEQLNKANMSSDSDNDSEPTASINPMADALLSRCIKLADEIFLFEKKLLQRLPPKQRSKKGNLPVELRHFKNAIQVEQRLLEALSYKSPTDEKVMHSLRSSNLKFLESVWAVAKTCTGLQVLFRTVYLISVPPDLHKPRGKEKKDLKKKKTPVQVDIIAQSGLEWIKVANISEARLATEFAKARWEAEGFKDDTDDEDSVSQDGDADGETLVVNDKSSTSSKTATDLVSEFQQDSDAFSLVKSARSMVQAAQQTRVQYLHPEITIAFPNLTYNPENPDKEAPVHALITAILSTGARVQTANNILPSTSPPLTDVEDVIHKLSRDADPVNLITDNIVMDCTMLLALVSDLSHEEVPEKPIFHRYILQQVRAEKEEPMVPHWIYPAVRGKRMVCTFDAYRRFKEIVEIVGSENEKLRAEVLVDGPGDWKHPIATKGKKGGDVVHASMAGYDIESLKNGEGDAWAIVDNSSRCKLLDGLRKLSRHDVPDDLMLPIKVVPSLEAGLVAHNPVAEKIGPELSSVNRSSLFTAWELGVTLVTTNGSVVKRLEWLVEENRTKDDDAGPKVHLLSIARSLVGKMKRSVDVLEE